MKLKETSETYTRLHVADAMRLAEIAAKECPKIAAMMGPTSAAIYARFPSCSVDIMN